MTLREVPAMKFLSIHHGLAVMLVTLAMAPSASALTLKTGEVLGSDGKVYEGASPEEREKIIKGTKDVDIFGNAKKTSGIRGKSLYVVVDEEVVFVPLKELVGKSKATQMDILKEHLAGTLPDLDLDDIAKGTELIEAQMAERMKSIEQAVSEGASLEAALEFDRIVSEIDPASMSDEDRRALEETIE